MRNQNKCYDDSYKVKQNKKKILKFGGTGLNPAENHYISFFLSLPSALLVVLGSSQDFACLCVFSGMC